ncbi:MAG TPA: 50S ribosomal protein L32e [Thermoplasmata archaeon]|nr:50S ribosomal protein L32e [Thermoplasmata archaeon]
MADEAPASVKSAPPAAPARPKAKPAAQKSDSAPAPKTAKAAPASSSESKKKAEKEEEMGAPKHPTLSAQTVTLLRTRRAIRRRRPIFGRQAANRYFRIGRDGAWRRPRGLQSKQRRHYGYRAQLVSIGYGSPAKVRGLSPSGYRPILVQSDAEIEGLNPKVEAAIISRRVGTRRRLGLEETARKLGVRVLNPIRTGGGE